MNLFFCHKDLAVSAPYEDSGVVYIFHGDKTGLNSKPDQVRVGKKIFSLKVYSLLCLLDY